MKIPAHPQAAAVRRRDFTLLRLEMLVITKYILGRNVGEVGGMMGVHDAIFELTVL